MLNGMMTSTGWVMMWSMMLGTLLWIVLMAVLIWALVTWLTRRTTQHLDAARSPAEEILTQRFARGDIDAATFQQMRDQLGSASPS
jgi:putative membrane protein